MMFEYNFHGRLITKNLPQKSTLPLTLKTQISPDQMEPTTFAWTALTIWGAAASWSLYKRRYHKQTNSTTNVPLTELPESAGARSHKVSGADSYQQDQKWIRHSMGDQYQTRSPGGA